MEFSLGGLSPFASLFLTVLGPFASYVVQTLEAVPSIQMHDLCVSEGLCCLRAQRGVGNVDLL